jgi:hypothetical protein
MPVLRPRNRLVIFRLSEDEYEDLKIAYVSRGARSLSDFARSAVLRSAGIDRPADEPLQTRLSSLGRKVTQIESRVERLLKLLEDQNGR